MPSGWRKMRGHGKPVGESADHRGLRRRADDAEPMVARLERARDDEQHHRGDEQQRRPSFHRVELRLARRLVGEDLHRHRPARRRRTARKLRLRRRRLDDRHRGVTLTLEKSTSFVLEPAGTSTYSTTGRPSISRTLTSIVRFAVSIAPDLAGDRRLHLEPSQHHIVDRRHELGAVDGRIPHRRPTRARCRPASSRGHSGRRPSRSTRESRDPDCACA